MNYRVSATTQYPAGSTKRVTLPALGINVIAEFVASGFDIEIKKYRTRPYNLVGTSRNYSTLERAIAGLRLLRHEG